MMMEQEFHPAYFTMAGITRGQGNVVQQRAFSYLACLLYLLLGVGGGAFIAERYFVSPSHRKNTSYERSVYKKLAAQIDDISEILRVLVPTVGGLIHVKSLGKVYERNDSSVTIPEYAKIVFVRSSRANLRETPSIEGRVVGILTKAARVVVLEEQEEWLKVVTPNGEIAWIARKVVDETIKL